VRCQGNRAYLVTGVQAHDAMGLAVALTVPDRRDKIAGLFPLYF